MADITITHTDAEGTLLHGLDRSDTAEHAAIKAHTFTFRQSVGWFIRGSRHNRVRMDRIRGARDALTAMGHTVTLDIETAAVAPEVREAHLAEQAVARAAALEAKAQRKGAEADSRLGHAHDLAQMIPPGQPILVDHYSAPRHRAHLKKIDVNMRKGIEALNDAESAADRAASARVATEHRNDVPVTLRRIKRLEADRTYLVNTLALCPTSGRKLKADQDGPWKCFQCGHAVTLDGRTITEHGPATRNPEWAERTRERVADLDTEIAYWESKVAEAEAAGVKVWGPADFAKGDLALTRFGSYKVARVNKKSLGLDGYHSTTLPYDKVLGRTAKEDRTDV